MNSTPDSDATPKPKKPAKKRARKAKERLKGKGQGQVKKAGGRPSLYREEYDDWARKLCRLGATNEELAESFGVAVSTIDLWIAKKSGFSGAVKEGRLFSDATVADRLFKRATGYSHDAVHILNNKGVPVVVPYVKSYAPDTLAIIFWLKNRRPDLWRDRVGLEHTGPGGGPIQTEAERLISPEDEEVIRRIRETRENLQKPKEDA